MLSMRTIVESDDVKSIIDAAIKQYPRIEALWEGWKWRLSHDPSADAVKIDGAFLIKSADLTTYLLPSGMTILYKYDDAEVEIISLRISN